jgi:hypothetical protein
VMTLDADEAGRLTPEQFRAEILTLVAAARS